MMQDALPSVKSFFRIGSFAKHAQRYVARMMIAFLFHAGRMSASQAAVALRTDVRHRAQVSWFLSGSGLANGSPEYQKVPRFGCDKPAERPFSESESTSRISLPVTEKNLTTDRT